MAGVNMAHVPYRGRGRRPSDLIGGQAQMVFEAVPGAAGLAKAG